MIEITWLGHGTIQLCLESGEVYLIDPWLEGNPSYPKSHSISRLDHILLTHPHFDHIADAIPLAKQFGCQITAIYETATWLNSKGVEKAVGMNKGGTLQLGPLAATMTHAIHSAGIQDGNQMIYGGEAAGFVLHLPDSRRIYAAGDTAIFSDMQLIGKIYKPQLAILPIGDLYTMSPHEAQYACRMLNPEKVIPVHWGTFPPLTGRPAELAKLIQDLPETKVWELTPGVPVQW